MHKKIRLLLLNLLPTAFIFAAMPLLGNSVHNDSGCLKDAPVAAILLILLLIGIYTAVSIISESRKAKELLTLNSVKETFDTLPAGICFFSESGLPVLCNTQMHRLAYGLLGKDLQMQQELKSALVSPAKGVEVLKIKEKNGYRMPDGTVWAFSDTVVKSEAGIQYTQFTATEFTKLYNLQKELANISSNQQMDIVIVTVNDLDGETPRDYADDFYDFKCYAEDGVLLLISMENSDWYISTSGYGITAVTDAGREYMAEQFVHDLGDGDYYDAFVTYADLCDEFINMARSGDPFDVDDLPKEDFNYIRSLLVSLGIGLVVALIIIGRMKGKLKTVRRQAEAAEYVKTGSMKVTQSRDLFLYKHIDRHAKPKESTSGGSRTHTSSSGRTHGGGGGKF